MLYCSLQIIRCSVLHLCTKYLYRILSRYLISENKAVLGSVRVLSDLIWYTGLGRSSPSEQTNTSIRFRFISSISHLAYDRCITLDIESTFPRVALIERGSHNQI